MTSDLVHLGEEAADALADRRPVVALESTIISHGMPYPDNLAMARSVEAIVRDNGATPCTIALIDGTIQAGLTDAELAAFADKKNLAKASARDLAALMARRESAGTTVSATMRVARLAGVDVFGTGGVGGVHRGAESSFDISADLIELGRTQVTVVSAGVKSLLDIPKTLEVLETQGVPVIAFQSDDFPAFYSRSSGLKADHRLDSEEDIARAMILHARLGSGSGILVANPVPEADALDRDFIDGIISRAVADADAREIARKALTPFLLAKIVELSGGRSLAANIALVRNNARLAARIAVAHARLKKQGAP